MIHYLRLVLKLQSLSCVLNIARHGHSAFAIAAATGSERSLRLNYNVVVLRSVARALSRLPRQDVRRIAERIDSLAGNPRPPGSRTLHGQKGYLRLRVGSYRVLYRVSDDIVEVTVVRVAHRRDAYRNLSGLDRG